MEILAHVWWKETPVFALDSCKLILVPDFLLALFSSNFTNCANPTLLLYKAITVMMMLMPTLRPPPSALATKVDSSSHTSNDFPINVPSKLMLFLDM